MRKQTVLRVVGAALLCAALIALLSWCSLEAGHLCRSDIPPAERCEEE